ncbi:hypothetical protein [Actinoplanes regularis]|uniref:hypothetical protein n=1 Tax=Actinoplanes regularis TaxID=52697 RepID=UPI002556AE79|nr:hypothetical protein [Actinoplanes regularis]GLW27881.1 hypothetical protein Areg01_08210 [Actinoplanes regularis]
MVLVPIVFLWLVMSREPRTRWTIAAGLAGQAAIATLLLHFFPRGAAEIALSALVLGLATVLTGRLIERGRLGPPKQIRVAVATFLVAGWSLMLLLGGVLLFKPAPFFPATDKVLPLPEGLHATVHPTGDGACGSGWCMQLISVTGRPGQADDDLYAEVRRHVKERGWGTGCRPAGWLLDRTTECVELAVRDHQVIIDLSGGRDDVRNLVTIG